VLINYGEGVPATGYAQAVALQFGKGRIVILGEAAMLTAQLDGKTKKPFGMNVPGIDKSAVSVEYHALAFQASVIWFSADVSGFARARSNRRSMTGRWTRAAGACFVT